MVIITIAKGGLMYDATLGDQKYNYKPSWTVEHPGNLNENKVYLYIYLTSPGAHAVCMQ